MSNNKSSDIIGLIAEMLKHAPIPAKDLLLGLLNALLVHGCLPKDWRTTHCTMLAKHTKAKSVDEFRPIALLSICYKVYAKLLNTRARRTLDVHQTPSQAGFREGHSVDHHLLALAVLLKRVHEYDGQLWAISIDLSKAFDRVN